MLRMATKQVEKKARNPRVNDSSRVAKNPKSPKGIRKNLP
jgi:hypothetical protein